MKRGVRFTNKYWFYFGLCLLCTFVCLFSFVGNINRTDGWTGDKPFSDFSTQDWFLLIVFLVEELVLLGALICGVRGLLRFAALAYKVGIASEQKADDRWEEEKYFGIDPLAYDYIWFDYSRTQRALVLEGEGGFQLYIQEYDPKTGNWVNADSVGVYESLESLKADLSAWDFYCSENANVDKDD